MTTEEKIDLLNSYDDLDELTDKHFAVLRSLSTDDDAYVRSLVASLLVDFDNKESRNLLLMLATDDDPLVRTEAYDSLSAFCFPEVEKKLIDVIAIEKDDMARSYAILSLVNVVLHLESDPNQYVKLLQKLELSEKSDACILGRCYGLYLFGDDSYLEKVLSFLEHGDYHLRCMTLNLLPEIITEKNESQILDSIALLAMREESVAVKSTIMSLFPNTHIKSDL